MSISGLTLSAAFSARVKRFGFLVIVLGVVAGYFTIRDVSSLELLLTDPQEFQSPADRCANRPCKQLLALLRGSDKSIDFAVYGMRNQTALLDALLEAKKRGVVIRGVVDQDMEGRFYYSSTPEWMKRLGNIKTDLESERRITQEQERRRFNPGCKRPKGFEGPLQCLAYDLGTRFLVAAHASREHFGSNRIMHHKFFVIDSKWVWTGSSNISDSGTGGYNANAVIVADAPGLARIYEREFEQMWRGAFHEEKEGDGVERLKIGKEEVFVWFSPQDSPMRWGVQPLIARAHERIDIGVFFLTDKWITANLIEAHRRGVRVRVIVDATSAKNGYTKHELLREAGVAVKVENWGGKMHMKTAAIDGEWLVVGSMNWTSSGARHNDENTLIIRSSRLTGKFHDYIGRIWNRIPSEWTASGARPDPESRESGASCFDGIDNDFDGLADKHDAGCGRKPAPLLALPPHKSVKDLRQVKAGGYRPVLPTRCEPSYPDHWVCIPEYGPRKQFSCENLPYRGLSVLKPDPYRLDKDGDGTGCELF